MGIAQRIKSLLPINGVKNIAELERACNISNGSIGKWDAGAYQPTTRSLEKVAIFLGVSTDFLLGIEKPANPITERPVSPAISTLLNNIQDLDSEEAAKTLEYVQLLKLKRTKKP